jgi:methionyl-tRNA formyltransferase
MNLRSNNKSIVLLGRQSKSTQILYNFLSKYHSIVHVIIEKEESKSVFLKKRIKKLGIFKVLDQLLFILTCSKVLDYLSKDRVKEILKINKLSTTPIPYNKLINVDSVNSEEVINLIKNNDYKIIILSGTRIISRKFISSTSALILNIHAGITPNYRGVHGAYWALVNKEKHLTGVTLHRVDEGIDTGSIISQKLIDLTDEDNFATYPFLQLSAGLKLLLNFLSKLDKNECDNAKILGNINLSKQWYHPGFFEYLFYRFTLKAK